MSDRIWTCNHVCIESISFTKNGIPLFSQKDNTGHLYSSRTASS